MERYVKEATTMDTIIQITGNVNFAITLDASTWIFDDRKLDLNTYFTAEHIEVDPDEKYVKEANSGLAKSWKAPYSLQHYKQKKNIRTKKCVQVLLQCP